MKRPLSVITLEKGRHLATPIPLGTLARKMNKKRFISIPVCDVSTYYDYAIVIKPKDLTITVLNTDRIYNVVTEYMDRVVYVEDDD